MATNPDPNGGPYYGPYVDPKISSLNGRSTAPLPWGPIGATGPTPAVNAPGAATAARADAPGTRPQVLSDTDKATPVYDTPDVDHAPGDQGAVPPPNLNSWGIEDDVINADTPQESVQSYPRDPYRDNGLAGPFEDGSGQPFLKNQGDL